MLDEGPTYHQFPFGYLWSQHCGDQDLFALRLTLQPVVEQLVLDVVVGLEPVQEWQLVEKQQVAHRALKLMVQLMVPLLQ